MVSSEGYCSQYCVKLAGKGSWRLIVANQMSVLPYIGCVTLGKPLNLSHQEREIMMVPAA